MKLEQHKSNPLISRLITAACLLLVAVCLEVFVFPLFPKTPIVAPATDSSVTNQNPSDPGKDTEANQPGSSVTYEVKDYEFVPSESYIVIIDGEEIDIRTESGKIFYDRYTIIQLHDHDQEFFNVWF